MTRSPPIPYRNIRCMDQHAVSAIALAFAQGSPEQDSGKEFGVIA